MPEQYTINGTITSANGAELAGFRVQAFDRDLPSLESRTGAVPQLLGETTTDPADPAGTFHITYTLEQFKDGEGISLFGGVPKQSADISFRVFRAGQELNITGIEAGNRSYRAEEIIFNAPTDLEDVNIFLDAPPEAGTSEYERLIALIAPVVEDLPLIEISDEDIFFLINELGLEQQRDVQQRIEWLRRCALLAQETGLPTEAFYGWGREDVPADLAELAAVPLADLPKVLEKLTSLDAKELREALLAAIVEEFIPAGFREGVGEIVLQLIRRVQILHSVDAQLQDEDTQEALAGYRVTTFDQDADDENRSLDISDNEGKFSFSFYAPRNLPQDAPARRFTFEIQNSEGEAIPEVEAVDINPNQPEKDIIKVTVRLPKPPLPTLEALQQGGQLDIPDVLLVHLRGQQIHTFADIRRRGGLSQLPNLPQVEPALLNKLDSLADLDRISSSVEVNTQLIEKGFDWVAIIANSDRSNFMKRTHALLGDFNAVKLHTSAKAQTNFSNNFVFDAMTAQANGFPLTAEQKLVSEVQPQKCGCKDCEAAVRPLAYLADLIRYTTQHILNDGQAINIVFLVKTFYQQFRDLSSSCEASERQIRQVRICIEVLRSYLKDNNPSPAQLSTLQAQEQLYRIAAYTSLLSKNGTSFDEIRRAKSSSIEERQVLVDRIGIDITPSLPTANDELGQLLLDLDNNAAAQHALSEQKLEELFGLVDTNRDVLSEGAKLGDSKGQINRWNLDNLLWGKNTDTNGSVFLSLTHDLVASVYRIEIFHDKDRTKLLASAESAQPEDTVSLLPNNASELFGNIQYSYAEDAADVEIVAVPRLLSWRLRHLRKLWEQEDRPADPYSLHLLPIIDPDLVGPNDFRPTQPAIPNPVLTRWQARRAKVDAILAATKATREKNADKADKGVGAVLAASIGKTFAELKAIKADSEQTNDAGKRSAAIDTINTTLHLATEAFNELITLLATASSLEATQWEEVYGILTQAQKTARFPDWIAEERADAILLGPKDFWIAMNEPKSLPKWLSSKEARLAWQQSLTQRSQPAIIDPDLVPANYLADPLMGSARTRWKERYEAISQLLKDDTDQLKATQLAGGDELAYFNRIVEETVSVASTALVELEAKRAEGRSIEKELAQLTLSAAAFNYLLKFQHLLEQANQMLDAEWQSVFSILVQVWKERQFARWREEESQDGITLSQDHFRLPVPSETALLPQLSLPLPKWRATQLAQRDWQDRLDTRINAELTVFAGIADAIDTTEEATLATLRDGLIQALQEPDINFEQTAQQFIDRLLIDAKMGACQKTTRVAQAIETLQMLLFRLRSGQIEQRKDWVVLPNSLVIRPGSAPSSAALTIGGAIDGVLAVVGEDNRIYSTFASRMFAGPWTHVGAATNHTIPADSKPSLFSSENQGDASLFATGSDGHINFTLSRSGNDWSQWDAIGDIQVRTNAKITVAAMVQEQLLHAFVVQDDGLIFGNWRDDTEWHNWTQIGTNTFRVPTDATVAAASLKREIQLFAVGNDGTVYRTQVNRNLADNWTPIDAAGTVTFLPGAAISVKGTSVGDAIVELVAVGKDGGIYHTSWNEMTGDWAAWSREGTLSITSDATVTMAGEISSLRLFTVGKDSRVYAKTGLDWQPVGDTTTPAELPVAARFDAAGAIHLYLAKGNQVLTTSQSAPGASWNLSVFSLILQAPHFDDEWKWIGSYATWRAAMFVFLYPENLLLPNLKRYKTPAFDRLISNRRLTPEKACAAAREYAEYVKDVCSLTVEASCQTKTKIYKQGTCQADVIYERHLLYLFGRTPSGKVYWSVFDPSEKSGYPQRPWQAWPFGEIALTISGATPYTIDSARRFIYVFFIKKAKLPTAPNSYPDVKISFARLDLITQDWDGNIPDLPEPPVVKSRLRVVVHQGIPEKFPPVLAMWPSDSTNKYGRIIQRALNVAGDGWRARLNTPNPEWADFTWHWGEEGSGSYPIEVKPLLPIEDLHGAYGLTLPNFWSGDGELFVTAKRDQLYRWHEDPLGGDAWLGMYVLGTENKSDITSLTFFRKNGTKTPTCARVEYKHSNDRKIVNHPTLANLLHVIPNWGSAPAAEARVVYMRKTGSATETCCCPVISQAPDIISGRKPTLVLPSLPNNQPILVSMPGQDQAKQKLHQQQVYQANNLATQSILALLEEAYFLVPMYLASRLQASGEYTAALDWYRTVYDYGLPAKDRKIYDGLKQEETLSDLYKRPSNWELDPLDPHAVAKTRRNTYTRFTILSIARCMQEFADAEFTRDTSESLPRARELYTNALELLVGGELEQHLDGCDALVGELQIPFEASPLTVAALSQVTQKLATISDLGILSGAIAHVNKEITRAGVGDDQLKLSRVIVTAARTTSFPQQVLGEVLSEGAVFATRQQAVLLTSETMSRAMDTVGQTAVQAVQERIAVVAGVNPEALVREQIDLPWLVGPGAANGDSGVFDNLDGFEMLPAWNYPSVTFCIPPNPILQSLRLHAELSLRKIRTCRNIAGLQRQVDPYAAPTDTFSGLPVAGPNGQIILPGTSTIRPTLYRYVVLIERAKVLVQLAAQVEGALLASLEKGANEAYNLLKARQELGFAQANVRLQSLRLTQSEHGITLAEHQKSRAQIIVSHFESLIEQDLLVSEEQALFLLSEAASAYAEASGYSFISASVSGAAAIAGAIAGAITGGAGGSVVPGAGTTAGAVGGGVGGAILGGITGGLAGVASGFSSLAGGYSSIGAKRQTRASLLQAEASYERRREDWDLQLSLGNKDVEIGQQQILIADDQKEIVEQEKTIAELQTSNAKDTIEFLNTKFSNLDLYEWMSDVLEDVYRFFLQQANSLALLALYQLAFERQETPPAYIQSDYWEAPTEGFSTDAKAPDRKGLTGSTRLLRDIYELDQYAFETNKRKLHLAKTISLALLAPAEFRRFTETGVMIFATPMELFDRGFPGHYLRLIRRVRTSVIALIPPTQGIHATLTASGLSRTVIGPEIFQTISIRRDPEFVALTSPANSTGVVELEALQNDMLFPFEGNGMDSTWEFRMPKAANQFDYRSIADVLITIEYTALNSFDYRQQVIQNLNPKLSADRPISFRNQLADQWYDLHNPDQTKVPMTVTFKTSREDFPPNLDALKIQQVVLYFVRAKGEPFEVPVRHLRYTTQEESGTVGGSANSIDGIISTRRGNAGSWIAMIGKSPAGEWELALPNTEEMRNRFGNEDIEDILLVITYSGRTPDWPQ
jgi:hypothetical protein